MTSVSMTRRRAALLVVALLASFLVVLAPKPAGAAPAALPPGAVDFYIMGGRVKIGTAAPIDLALSSPDTPPECSDGVDNESGTYHNGWDSTASTFRPNVPATDTLIDYPADNSCINASDNSELIDRNTQTPDPAPLCGSEGYTVTIPCSDSSYLDSMKILASGTANDDPSSAANRMRMSVNIGDGNGTTGQAKVRNRATGGTVTAGTPNTVAVPQANVVFGPGYQVTGTCTNDATAGILCLDLYIQFKIIPQAAISGTSSADGSGTVNLPIKLQMNIGGTFSTRSYNFFGSRTPTSAKCDSASNISLALTTETSGTLQGVRYDNRSKNFKVVQSGASVPVFNQTSQDGTLSANLCTSIGSTLGLPDSNAQFELVISTEANTVTSGVSQTGTGMASFPGIQPPKVLMSASREGTVVTTDQSVNTSMNVNEGDRVDLSSFIYDPAMRALGTGNGFARSGGTATWPPPALLSTSTATTGSIAQTYAFVAQDAPAAGNTIVFTGTSGNVHLGPLPIGDPNEQVQSDTNTLTINVANVAPTATPATSMLVDGGVAFTLKGSSTDPGDPDLAGSRGYCWTETGGTLAATTTNPPACSGTPNGNGKNINITPPNTTGTLTYSLVVADKDGATSSPVTVTVNVRATTAGVISGNVRRCNPTCAVTSGIGVSLLKDSVGLVGSTTTDASGNYSFSGQSGTGYYVRFGTAGTDILQYNGGGYWPSTTKRLTVPTATVDMDIYTQAQGGTLTVNVKDAATASVVSGTNVRLYDDSGWIRSVASDGSGNAAFALLPPKSTYRINLAKGNAGYVEEWYDNWDDGSMGTKVTVPTAGTTVNANISATPSGVGTITGSITGSGCTVGTAEARLYKSTGGWVKTVAPSGGNFSFTNVLPGTYTVWVWNKSGGTCTSQWYNGVRGPQYTGSGKLATVITVTAGGTNALGTFALTT